MHFCEGLLVRTSRLNTSKQNVTYTWWKDSFHTIEANDAFVNLWESRRWYPQHWWIPLINLSTIMIFTIYILSGIMRSTHSHHTNTVLSNLIFLLMVKRLWSTEVFGSSNDFISMYKHLEYNWVCDIFDVTLLIKLQHITFQILRKGRKFSPSNIVVQQILSILMSLLHKYLDYLLHV